MHDLMSRPLFGSMNLKDFLAVGGLIVAVTLAFSQLKSDTTVQGTLILSKIQGLEQSLDSKIQQMSEKMRESESKQRDYMLRVTMELWVERARQVTAFKDLPALPTSPTSAR